MSLQCTWGPNDYPQKAVAWKQSKLMEKTMWTFRTYESRITVNEASKDFEDRLELGVVEKDSHGIKFKYVTDEDDGQYWCIVTIGHDNFRAPKKELKIEGKVRGFVCCSYWFCLLWLSVIATAVFFSTTA